MPFALPRNRTQQAAYNRQLQDEVRVDSPGRAAGAGRGTRPGGAICSELGELHRSGVLTDAEFESAKARLLAR